MGIEKRHQIWYDLNSFNKFILNCFEKKNGLRTIIRKLKNKSPLDEIVILAHILNVARPNQVYFTKNQIRYCFNVFHKRERHGDKDSYLKFLYALRGEFKGVNNAISRSKKAVLRDKKTKDSKLYVKPKKPHTYSQNKLSPTTSGDNTQSKLKVLENENN